jgi:hypothetical protein
MVLHFGAGVEVMSQILVELLEEAIALVRAIGRKRSICAESAQTGVRGYP